MEEKGNVKEPHPIVINLTPPHSRRGSMDETQEDRDEHIQWKTCCSNSSKAFIKYIFTISISVMILLFSAVMIVLNPDDDNSIYFSLISSIMTLYVSPPNMKK